MSVRKLPAEGPRIDPRCRKTHRPRIDFESPDLRWFCETCHADLVIADNPFRFVLAACPEARR